MKKLFVILSVILGLSAASYLTYAAMINNDNVDGKSYYNDEFNYSLNYPKSWKLEISPESPVGHVKISAADTAYEGDLLTAGAFMEIYVLSKDNSADLSSWLASRDMQIPEQKVLAEENIDINGFKGVKRIISTFGDEKSPSFDYYLESSDKIYELAGVLNERQPDVEKILASFKIDN